MKYNIRQTSYIALPGLKFNPIFFDGLAVQYIIKCTAEGSGITVKELLSKSQKRKVVNARKIAMLLSKNKSNLSAEDIGEYFGGKDHTTVLHAIKSAKELALTNEPFKQQLLLIENKLGK